MQKFKAVFKHTSGVQVNSPNHQAWLDATPETHPHFFGETLIVVTDGRIFRKQPRHYTGVINRRAAGGKWEEITDRVKRSGFSGRTIDEYLKAISAVESSFRGSPRIK